MEDRLHHHRPIRGRRTWRDRRIGRRRRKLRKIPPDGPGNGPNWRQPDWLTWFYRKRSANWMRRRRRQQLQPTLRPDGLPKLATIPKCELSSRPEDDGHNSYRNETNDWLVWRKTTTSMKSLNFYLIAASRAAALLLLLLEWPRPEALRPPPLTPLLGDDWLLESSGISIVPK